MPKNLKKNKIPPVFVIVEGGVVTDVLNSYGKRHPQYIVFDHDAVECGECMICNESIADSSTPCPECGFINDIDDEQEAIKAAKKYYSLENI